MERSSTETVVSSVADQEATRLQRINLGSLVRNAKAGVAIAACAIVGVASGFASHKNSEQVAQSNSGLEMPGYKDLSSLWQIRQGDKHVLSLSDELSDGSYIMDITQPDKANRQPFNSYFGSEPHAALRETIHIRDSNTFAGEHAAEPNIYPFTIYNATDRPVDLLFAWYALRGTQSWLNTAQKEQGLAVESHTLFEAEPVDVPHVMIMTDIVPASLTTHPNHKTIAVTSRSSDITKSFIKFDPSRSELVRKQAVAVEICNSLLDTTDTKLVPGEALQQAALLEHVGDFNKYAKHDVDLAIQESVCNALGRVLASAYLGGEPLVRITESKVPYTGNLLPIPWMDYKLFDSALPKLLWLAKHIPYQEYSEVIASRDAHTPTIDYYRQHADFTY